jgi:hypothetical protein
MSSVASASQSRSPSQSNRFVLYPYFDRTRLISINHDETNPVCYSAGRTRTHENGNNGIRESFLVGGRPTRPTYPTLTSTTAAAAVAHSSSSTGQVRPSPMGEEETGSLPEQEQLAAAIPLDPVDHRCPYHDAILQMIRRDWQQPVPQQQQQQSIADDISDYDDDNVIMARYMARHNHPGEQYALFHRLDNGQLSTFRACTCYHASGIVINVDDHDHDHDCFGVNGCDGDGGEGYYQLDDLDLSRDGEINSFLVGL